MSQSVRRQLSEWWEDPTVGTFLRIGLGVAAISLLLFIALLNGQIERRPRDEVLEVAPIEEQQAKEEPSEPARQRAIVGDRAVIESSDGGVIRFATSQAAFEKFQKVARAGDDIGLQEMFWTGELKTTDNGTECLVLDSSWSWLEVRLLNGPHAQKRGFVIRSQVYRAE